LRPRAPARFVGVLGWPLGHTLSPVIYNAAFRQLGMNWIYLAWPVRPDALGEAVRGLRALGAMGANVTMPHKEAVVDLLDELSGDARAIGAVNTIQQLGSRLIGHNTDVEGFREFLVADAGVDLAGKGALVLGAGGAARAIVRAVDGLGAREIVVAARRVEKGEPLVELATPGRALVCSWEEVGKRAEAAELIVNATPLGMKGEDPLPGARFQAGQVIVDLIYEPPSTVLVERARAAGADVWGGLGMLVHQAAASFRIWTGREPPIETMSAAAVHAVGGEAHRRS
jgi:shikimate dehydrogenase